jgi:hypothetical protein
MNFGILNILMQNFNKLVNFKMLLTKLGKIKFVNLTIVKFKKIKN